VVNDLISPENSNLKIHEHMTRGVHVGNLTEVSVSSPEEVKLVISKGEAGKRTTIDAAFACLAWYLLVSHFGSNSKTQNLVDLAGSERAAHTGAEGKRLKEGGSINKSLLALATVIGKLSEEGVDGVNRHIPYRNSKITRILQPSLGGNARTLIICTVTPSMGYIDETISTLKFASRAKTIRNKPVVNEVVRDDVLIKQYREEISLLKTQLNLIKESPASERILDFVPSDEFRQSYPVVVSRTSDLMMGSLVTPSQYDEIKSIMKSVSNLAKAISTARAEVWSEKTQIQHFVAKLHDNHKNKLVKLKSFAENAMNSMECFKENLTSKTQQCELLRAQAEALEKTVAQEVAMRLEAEKRVNEEAELRERLSDLVSEEKFRCDAISNELSARKRETTIISKKVEELTKTCTLQFQLPDAIGMELKSTLNEFLLSPESFSVADFLSLLEDMKESTVKTVYNELESSFETGKLMLMEELDKNRSMLNDLSIKTDKQTANISDLENESEIDAKELCFSSRTGQVDDLVARLQHAESQREEYKHIVKLKVHDFTESLIESFELREGDDSATHTVQNEFLQYFEVEHSIIPNKFMPLLNGCKNLIVSPIFSITNNSLLLESKAELTRAEMSAAFENKLALVMASNAERESELKKQVCMFQEKLESATNSNLMDRQNEKIEALEADLVNRNEENGILKSKLLEVESSKTNLKAIIESIANECTKRFHLQEENSHGRMRLTESLIDFHSEQCSIDSLTDALLIFMEEIVQHEVSTVKDDLMQKWDDYKARACADILSMTATVERLQRESHAKDVALKGMTNCQMELSEIQAVNAQMVSELSETKKALAASERSTKKLQAMLKDLEVQNSQIEAKNDLLQADFSAVSAKLEECMSELIENRNSNSNLMDEAIFADLQKTAQEKSRQSDLLEKENQKLVGAMSTIQSEADSLRRHLHGMERQHARLSRECANANERLAEQEQEIENFRLQDEFLRSRLAEFENSASPGDLGDAGNTLLSEIDDKRVRSEKLYKEVLTVQRRMQKQIQVLQREKRELQNQLVASSGPGDSSSEEHLNRQLVAVAQLVSDAQKYAQDSPAAAPAVSTTDGKVCADAYDLLQLELQEKIAENEMLRKENRGLKIISLNEMSKVRKAEFSISKQGKRVCQAQSKILELKDKLSSKNGEGSQDPTSDDVMDDSENTTSDENQAKDAETRANDDKLALPHFQQRRLADSAHANIRREKAAQKFKHVNIEGSNPDNVSECNTQ
ncbi:hypothetical protein HDU82_002200, partial [Entophlyctis luteolus]